MNIIIGNQENESEVVNLICCDCKAVLQATKDSDCHVFNRCTRCVNTFLKLWERSTH